MEAYKLFLKGQEDFDRYYYDEARRSLEMAVQMDPEFALPYYYLTRVYSALADAPRATEALAKFKKYGKTDMGKGKDGLYAAALSALVEKDQEGYVKGLKVIVRAFPDDKRAHVDLAWF
jgi:tetratricopeptide (TPR) repeat protein